jgi:hypothetical protein
LLETLEDDILFFTNIFLGVVKLHVILGGKKIGGDALCQATFSIASHEVDEAAHARVKGVLTRRASWPRGDGRGINHGGSSMPFS